MQAVEADEDLVSYDALAPLRPRSVQLYRLREVVNVTRVQRVVEQRVWVLSVGPIYEGQCATTWIAIE